MRTFMRKRKTTFCSTDLCTPCFKPAGMPMGLRSEVMRRPVIGCVPPQLLASQIRPPTPLPLHSARPPAHASTLTHLVKTSKLA